MGAYFSVSNSRQRHGVECEHGNYRELTWVKVPLPLARWAGAQPGCNFGPSCKMPSASLRIPTRMGQQSPSFMTLPGGPSSWLIVVDSLCNRRTKSRKPQVAISIAWALGHPWSRQTPQETTTSLPYLVCPPHTNGKTHQCGWGHLGMAFQHFPIYWDWRKIPNSLLWTPTGNPSRNPHSQHAKAPRDQILPIGLDAPRIDPSHQLRRRTLVVRSREA